MTNTSSILGKTINFQFNVDEMPSGTLRYHDKEQGIDLVSEKINGFFRLSATKVSYTGEGLVNGSKAYFTVECEDNGEPGTNDRFKIVITGATTSTREGALSQGNIQFHK